MNVGQPAVRFGQLIERKELKDPVSVSIRNCVQEQQNALFPAFQKFVQQDSRLQTTVDTLDKRGIDIVVYSAPSGGDYKTDEGSTMVVGLQFQRKSGEGIYGYYPLDVTPENPRENAFASFKKCLLGAQIQNMK